MNEKKIPMVKEMKTPIKGPPRNRLHLYQNHWFEWMAFILSLVLIPNIAKAAPTSTYTFTLTQTSTMTVTKTQTPTVTSTTTPAATESLCVVYVNTFNNGATFRHLAGCL